MKKKLLIGLGVFVLLLVAAFIYLNNRNRTLSPPGQDMAVFNGDTVSVSYSRPSVRDRMVFGEKEEGALQPYGYYWRLGANEPTIVEVGYDFRFGDAEVAAGKYVIYAIPRKGEMEIRLNSDLRLWGYTEPEYDHDIATVVIPVNQNTNTEQFTIDITGESNEAVLDFTWDKYQWQLPLERQ